MVYAVQLLDNGDIQVQLFFGLAYRGLGTGLAEVDAAARHFPTTALILGLFAALGQQQFSLVVKDHYTHPNANKILSWLHTGLLVRYSWRERRPVRELVINKQSCAP